MNTMIKLILNSTLVFTVLFSFLIVSFAEAQSSGAGGGGKAWLLSSAAEGRANKRFTLQEWMEGKDRRALMDMWLSMNTPSPYEFVLGGGQYQYELSSTTGGVATTANYDSTHADLSAYARFVGLTGEYQKNTAENFIDSTGLFNLRIFGQTVQGSHITLHYGLRTRVSETAPYRLNQQFPAATLQIYFMKYFGIQGHYRNYQPVTETFHGETSGDELRYGLFIEYGLLRLYGNIFEERQNSKLNSVETNYRRKGSQIGLQFYF